MENNSVVIKTFNAQFLECMQDIYKIYPENKKLKKYVRYIESIKKVNPSVILQTWKKHAGRYENDFVNDSIDLFLEKNYKEEFGGKLTQIELIIDELRELIRTTTKENRDRSFNYIKNLTELSKHYV